MKKILISLICVLILCSCGNKNKKYKEIYFDEKIVDNYQIVYAIKHNDNQIFDIYISSEKKDYSDLENVKIILYHDEEIIEIVNNISFDKTFINDNVIIANTILDEPNKNINKVSIYVEK